jgi:hypothetical protein
MEIKDLAGLSKPLTRLIEVISKGVGSVTAPYLTRKNAEAKAHEIRVISDALDDVAQQNNLTVGYKDGEIELWKKPEDQTLVLEEKLIEHRSEFRVDYQARKEQSNIESVTSTAALELASDESVASELPDDDWVTRFFKYAQDISSEQMQDLWGRILAGEIRRPGTFSLRTLDFVRNMTRQDAELLERIGKLAITWAGTAFVDARDTAWLEADRNISLGLLFHLAELDLLYPTTLALPVFREQSIDKEYFFLGERILVVERGDIAEEIQFNVWKFTTTGMELLPLVLPHNDDTYLERLGLFFVDRKGKASLSQFIGKDSSGQVTHKKLREVIKPEPSSPNQIE